MRGRVLDTSVYFAHTAISIDVEGAIIGGDSVESSHMSTNLSPSVSKADGPSREEKNF